MKNIIVEVCAGNVQDCITAEKFGANQIELNSGVFMGGLTPSLSTVKMAKEMVSIPIFPMLRPRGAGFHYNALEIETMRQDAHLFAKAKADGLVFGFLNEDRTIDTKTTKEFVAICNEYNIEAVFHRAYDNVVDPIKGIEDLIECGVTRILTSGLGANCVEGIDMLKTLQENYGDKIQILAGAGVNKDNVLEIVEKTGVKQVHGSFKAWAIDPTTTGDVVDYAFSDQGSYDIVGEETLEAFMNVIK